MKFLKVSFIFFLISGIGFSQSKKETIVILNTKVDSLKRNIANERNSNLKNKFKQEELIKKIDSLKSFKNISLNLLETEKKRLLDQLDKKNKKLFNLKLELPKNNSSAPAKNPWETSPGKNPFGSVGNGGSRHEKGSGSFRRETPYNQNLDTDYYLVKTDRTTNELNIHYEQKKSKKETIKFLKNLVDSLKQIERNEHLSNLEISKKQNDLKEQILLLEKENNILINRLDKQYDSLSKEINLKKDSIVLLYAELRLKKYGPIKKIKIGNQVWMLENLNVSSFKNAEDIQEAKSKEEWIKAGKNHQAAWCYYDNDLNNGLINGKLYNWYAVIDTNGLCPQGWHMPTNAEWDTLITYLGGEYNATTKIKSKPIMKKKIEYYEVGGYYDTKTCSNCSVASKEYKKICPVCKGIGYLQTNKYIPVSKEKYISEQKIGGWDGNNESGFNGLPSGVRKSDGDFNGSDKIGSWWSSTDYSSEYAKNFRISDDYYSNKRENDKTSGFSVRCIEGDLKIPKILSGTGFGSGTGTGEGGAGSVSGRTERAARTRLTSPEAVVDSDQSGVVYIQVTINAEGDVIKAISLSGETTITNQRVINQVLGNVKKQVKYNKVPNSTPQTQRLRIDVKAQ